MARHGPALADDEPLTVRATTLDPRLSWHRWAVFAVLAVAVVLALSVGVAWWQDRSNSYPGYRDPKNTSALAASVLPPTNALVDSFAHQGSSIGRVGSLRWTDVVGGAWHVADDGVHAGPTGGTIVVDPHRTSLIVQVEVFVPVQGAGLVFRWRNADNHLSVEVAPGGTTWQVVATVGGHPRVLAGISVNPQGSTVGVTLNGSEVTVEVNGSPKYTHTVPELADETAVGLTAPSGQTAFAQFALLPG